MNFIEKVNEIKNSKLTNSAKRRALIEIGLSERDANLVIITYQNENREKLAQQREQRLLNAQLRDRKNGYTFGVEIECIVKRDRVQENAPKNNFNYRYEGYNHTDGKDYFKFVTDGSVTARTREEWHDEIECVSPILKGKNGFELLKSACTTLNESGAYVNKSCGLHVHIGAANLTEEEYCNVFINYAYLENLIDSFMAPSRRNNSFAETLRGKIAQLEACKTRYEVCMVFNRCRYFKVNCVAYMSHKTIEFRQHQGSTDYEKIHNWVKFCGKLVNWSKKNRLTSEIRSIDDIPFLTKVEKKFFKTRQEKFNRQAA